MRIEIDVSEALDYNSIWEAAKRKGAPVLGTILCTPDPDYTFWTWYEPRDNVYVVEWEKESNRPGGSDAEDTYYNWEEQDYSENRLIYEWELEYLDELPKRERQPKREKK